MEFRCPNCLSQIYSRKAKVCGKCGQLLPKEFLLSKKQADLLKKQDEQLEKRAKEFQLPKQWTEIGPGSYPT